MHKGFVYLVGAGPGRADLITVRGADALRAADCVIYDKLANPALLQFVRRGAEIIHVPKRIGEGSCTQDEINKVLAEKALAGNTVVRLKGGDPCIFGRVAEELAVLIEAGVDFEIVPGVTSAVAVSSYTGIMLTDLKIQAKQQLDPAHFSKLERKGLRKIYKQELVKRSQLYRIAAAWVITVPASAIMAALIYYMIRGMLLP